MTLQPTAHILPATTQRVERNTADEVNSDIENATIHRIGQVAGSGPAAISQRLEELDREWDIERTLEANAATVSLIGLTMGFAVNRKWFIFPMAVAAFLLLHAVQGWCPPLPILRRLGLRTEKEINTERMALRILRGDFGALADIPLDAYRMAENDAATPQPYCPVVAL